MEEASEEAKPEFYINSLGGLRLAAPPGFPEATLQLSH